jgi:hypothetical protein
MSRSCWPTTGGTCGTVWETLHLCKSPFKFNDNYFFLLYVLHSFLSYLFSLPCYFNVFASRFRNTWVRNILHRGLWRPVILYAVTNLSEKHVTKILYTEDRSYAFLENFTKHSQDCMSSQPRRQQSIPVVYWTNARVFSVVA